MKFFSVRRNGGEDLHRFSEGGGAEELINCGFLFDAGNLLYWSWNVFIVGVRSCGVWIEGWGIPFSYSSEPLVAVVDKRGRRE